MAKLKFKPGSLSLWSPTCFSLHSNKLHNLLKPQIKSENGRKSEGNYDLCLRDGQEWAWHVKGQISEHSLFCISTALAHWVRTIPELGPIKMEITAVISKDTSTVQMKSGSELQTPQVLSVLELSCKVPPTQPTQKLTLLVTRRTQGESSSRNIIIIARKTKFGYMFDRWWVRAMNLYVGAEEQNKMSSICGFSQRQSC